MKRISSRSSRGFTLVELLLVLAILGFALAAVHRSFAQGLQLHERFAERSEFAASCRDLWRSVRADALSLGAADSVRVVDAGSVLVFPHGADNSTILYAQDSETATLARMRLAASGSAQADTLTIERFAGIAALQIETQGAATNHRRLHALTASDTSATGLGGSQSIRLWLPVQSALVEAQQ